MKKEVLGKCPVCGEELYVTELSCHKCHTHIRGILFYADSVG